jgi:hypothetical protein
MSTPTKSLYETDFHAWAFGQARRLRTGEPIDATHIAEDLESLGANEEMQLESRLIVLLAVSSSLGCKLGIFSRSRCADHEIAILRASDETGLPEKRLPVEMRLHGAGDFGLTQ